MNLKMINLLFLSLILVAGINAAHAAAPPVPQSAQTQNPGTSSVISSENKDTAPAATTAVVGPVTSTQIATQPAEQQVTTTPPTPNKQEIPTPSRRVLVIDMEGSGVVDGTSLQQGKDAMLVYRLLPDDPYQGVGKFVDQKGHRFRLLTDINDLVSLMSKGSYDIRDGNELYQRLALGYVLMNGRIQTVPLEVAGIKAIHVSNVHDDTKEGKVSAQVFSNKDNTNRAMFVVTWKGYL